MTLRTLVVACVVVAAATLAFLKLQPSEDSAKPSSIERATTVALGTNLRNVVTAIETYHASTGSYEGMTVGALSAIDASITNTVRIVRATAASYCVESALGTTVESKNGPTADIVQGPCPPS